MSITLVKAAIDARDWATVLTAALKIWRETRNPAVADVIDFASQKALEERRLPVPGTNEAMQLAWVQLSTTADVVTVGWLAAHLCERVPVDKYGRLNAADLETGKYRAWMERLTRLEALPEDPRIAEAAVSALLDPAFLMVEPADSPTLYAPLLRILKKTRDLRGLHRLKAELKNPRGKPRFKALKNDLLPRAIHMVEQASPLALKNESEWRALVSSRGASLSAAEQALLADVVANIDDDRPRQVYADWLLERGDPRGEFISLQLLESRGPVTKLQRQRAAHLFDKYGAAWEGALHDVVRVTFRRGFPWAITARVDRTSVPETSVELARHAPQLSTVEDTLWTGLPLPLLSSPQLVNVRALNISQVDQVRALKDAPLLQVITGLQLWEYSTFTEDDRVLLSGFQIPRLETVTLWEVSPTPGWVRAALQELPWLRRVPVVQLHSRRPVPEILGEFWPKTGVKRLAIAGRGTRFAWASAGLEVTCIDSTGLSEARVLLKKPPLKIAKVNLLVRLFSREHQAWMRGEAIPEQAELQKLTLAIGAQFELIHGAE